MSASPTADESPPRRRRVDPPGWSQLLDHAERTQARGERAPRDLLYAVDADASRLHEHVAIYLCEPASWTDERFRHATVHRHEIEDLDRADAAVLGALDALGAYRAYAATGPLGPHFLLSAAAAVEILPELCWTGRAHLTRGLAGLDGPPLVWDAGGLFTLRLEAAMDAHGALSIGALFARGTERISVHTPAIVAAGGVAVLPGRAFGFDDLDHFAWITTVRTSGRVPLAAADVPTIVERLAKAQAAPALELPPEHAFAEVQVKPRPWIVLRTPKAAEGETFVKAAAFAEYDGVHVLLSQAGRVVVDRARRRVLVRDAQAEAEAHALLEPNGVRRGPARDRGWDRLPKSRLMTAVRAFVRAGWRVELDGRIWRGATGLGFRVTTGIDWFDVGVSGDFDGVALPLPELLAAARQRRTTVSLPDGSVGIVGEEQLDRLERWAAMATAEGGALRFAKTQVALLAALADREPSLAADEAFAKQRAEIAAFDGIEPKDAPYGFRGTLRPYQRAALGWFAFLRRFGLGGCLADDMGLGKTVQVVALLEERRQESPPAGPSLVVTPRSLLHHWADEIARFAPDLRVHVHDGAARAKSEGDMVARLGEGRDVVVTTYGLLRRDGTALAKTSWDYVVLDEAQAIKNPKSAAAVAACALPARHRLALSGTPIENHLGELASIFAFANPGMLGGSRALAELGSGGRTLGEAERPLLAQALRPVILRRTKGQVAKDLPERIEQTIVCDLGQNEQRLYEELRARARAMLAHHEDEQGAPRSTMHILEALLRLRQAACHPGLVDAARRAEDSAKLDALLGHLESVRAEGRKALVFSQFATLLRIVRDRLDARGIASEYLDGSTEDRPARVARFQEDASCSVFLLSLKAGGVGLNLTAADCVFLLDPWWNPAAEAQAIDRAHRIGQRRTVFAYRLLARGTVEEKVAALQREKRALADALLGEGSAPLEGMSREDLELLLS